jgi:hypothetical protein
MKKRHGVFFGFAVLLITAIFTLAGCEHSPGDDGSIKISTAAQFNAIRDNLDGNYVLEADIDLSSYNAFESIGRFEPLSDEDAESPKLELAFTGSFDGKNHKISNVTVQGATGVGIFGCVAENGVVKNLVVENVTVSGVFLVGGVIGYGKTTSSIENITLKGTNSITNITDIPGYTMTGGIGGIVGGGFCDIKNCTAEASLVLNGDYAQGAGIIAGAMENCSIISCSAKGTVTSKGNGNVGIGGLAGCGHYALAITNCTADVTITIEGTGDGMIGGLVGYAGNDDEDPTIISGCTVEAAITATTNAERIGGIVGSGFYLPMYATYFPFPTAFVIRNSSSSGSISGGTLKGTIAGYIYNNSTVENTCNSTMSIDGSTGAKIGGDKNSAGLDTLK